MAAYAGYRRRTYRRYQSGLGEQAYVYGNTVQKPEVLPGYVPEGETVHEKTISRQVQKNRKKALRINTAYAVFLAGAAICAVVFCFLYLKLQSETVSRSENIALLQKELAELTEENNAAYQAAEDSVNLEAVRDRAVNELGMVYAAQGNTVSYETPVGDSVKQYNRIPKNGVLAKSGNPAE